MAYAMFCGREEFEEGGFEGDYVAIRAMLERVYAGAAFSDLEGLTDRQAVLIGGNVEGGRPYPEGAFLAGGGAGGFGGDSAGSSVASSGGSDGGGAGSGAGGGI